MVKMPKIYRAFRFLLANSNHTVICKKHLKNTESLISLPNLNEKSGAAF